MPQKIHWSPTADAEIRRLRAAGTTWNAVAAVLRVSHWTLMEHGRGIGARRPPVAPPPDRGFDDPEFDDPAREPLRPGHPASWDGITAGTLLAGVRYPFPPVVEEDPPPRPSRAARERGRRAPPVLLFPLAGARTVKHPERAGGH